MKSQTKNKIILLGGLLAAAAFIAAPTGSLTPITNLPMTRGYRNLNPFNIKKTGTAWLGKVAVSTDQTFEQFKTLELGIRAGMINMRTQIGRGYNTIQTLIGRHAPAMENPTSAFVKFVCARCGCSPTTKISASDKDLFPKFCAAVIEFENGHALPLATVQNVYSKHIR